MPVDAVHAEVFVLGEQLRKVDFDADGAAEPVAVDVERHRFEAGAVEAGDLGIFTDRGSPDISPDLRLFTEYMSATPGEGMLPSLVWVVSRNGRP